jgi:L-ribulose-5-phosphate 4-epimerase
VIVERFRKIDPMRVPAVLVRGHGPFTWGGSLEEAVENAIVLERVAQMASAGLAVNSSVRPIGKTLREKHFARKHGPSAYYGQKRK